MKRKEQKNSFYAVLFNQEGYVCGVQKSGNADYSITIGDSWSKIWPGELMQDGNSFLSKGQKITYLVRVSEIRHAQELPFIYLAILQDKEQIGEPQVNESIKDLKKKINFYETIINGSCDEVFITDGKGIIIFANPVSESHYGIPVSEMIGKSVWELEERGIYYPAVTPMVLREKKKITIDQETGIGKKLMLTATPIFNNKNEIEMVICNSRDVTALEDMKKSYHDIKQKVHNKQTGLCMKKSAEVESSQLVYAGDSPIAELLQMTRRIAQTESVVLLQGETGTGKDLFARQVHDLSSRRNKQFLKINCAALPQELIESELFGYKSGAFTGASPKGKIGRFSLADRGTIFLDEIGEVPLSLQPKLLQVIEEQKFTPIGSSAVEEVNVRIIASTNRDLKRMIGEGAFREDLYYRLCVLSIEIPPLRERKTDIPTLLNHYLGIFSEKHSRKIKLTTDAINVLVNYNWPGNVRELKHLTELLTVTVTTREIKIEHLPPHITQHSKKLFFPLENSRLETTLEAVERELVTNSYKKHGSSYKVASSLGISQSSAIRKIRKYLNDNNAK
ncbi:MAG: sigma 54-interacting transcriptional regulator [Bacillota bacterium]|nr:sigma 54-interacting transcriptional regulator [Bacillota bacterium]